MRTITRLLALLFFFTVTAGAQTVTLKRNVNLRRTPSANNEPIATLKPPACLNLVESGATEGYFHVKTADGHEGWVWGRNVKLDVCSQNVIQHIGPPQLYPDPVKTPGLADTLNVADLTKRYTAGCPSGKTSCTYSQAHRNVPESVHTQVYDEYNVPEQDRNIRFGEVDHFYPLCAGGSNNIENLWDQPAENEWAGQNFGYHEKDKLETYVCAEIKAGTMDPKEAYDRITKDWVKFYMDVGLDSLN